MNPARHVAPEPRPKPSRAPDDRAPERRKRRAYAPPRLTDVADVADLLDALHPAQAGSGGPMPFGEPCGEPR